MRVDPALDRVDHQGREVGGWAEVDSHGGTITGEHVAGERCGRWQRWQRWQRWDAHGNALDSGTWDRGAKSDTRTTVNPDGTTTKSTTHRPRTS